MSNTFNVRFILKTQKVNKKGLAPIFARIIFNRKKIEITTNRSIESWLPEENCALPVRKSNKELNRYLESYKGKIFSAYSTLLSTGEIINAENFKEAFFGKPGTYFFIHSRSSILLN